MDLDSMAFLSSDNLDKIVATGTVSYVNGGATTDCQTAKTQVDTIANPYGLKAYARAKWSVDGTNWNSLDSRLTYTFTYNVPAFGISQTLSGLKAAISVGVSDDSIYFCTANGYHGTVTENPIGVIAYTPISLTFQIMYSIYEGQ
jgi:hypothetical protein